MTKVTITLSDEEDGTVTVSTDFDPPIENEEDLKDLPKSHAAGISVLRFLASLSAPPPDLEDSAEL